MKKYEIKKAKLTQVSWFMMIGTLGMTIILLIDGSVYTPLTLGEFRWLMSAVTIIIWVASLFDIKKVNKNA